MGVRTRGLDIAINAKRQVADAAARAEAKGVVERWNEQLAGSRDMLIQRCSIAIGLPQQLRQPCEVYRHAPGLVSGQHFWPDGRLWRK
jgi:hypothetical protein